MSYNKNTPGTKANRNTSSPLNVRRSPATFGGMTNGLGSHSNGMTNGLGGKSNGITNGLGGRTNGLTNGLGGKTNGITNGLGGRTNGLTNGLGGMTNGLDGPNRMPRRLDDRAVSPSKISLVLIIAFLFMVPGTFFMLSYDEPVYTGLRVDGDFSDWSDSVIYSDSNTYSSASLDILDYAVGTNDAGSLFLYAASGGNWMSSADIDSLLVFIDSDGNPGTGYSVSCIGADYVAETYGWNGSLQGKQLGIFSGQDQSNWSAWNWRGLSAEAAATRMEIGITSAPITLAAGHSFLFMTKRGECTADVCSARISTAQCALSVKQLPGSLNGIIATDQVMGIELTAAGAAVDVSAIDFTFSGISAPTVSGLPVTVPAGSSVTLQVTAPVTALANGTFVDIVVSSVTCTGLVTLIGERMSAYANSAPAAISIDGAFGDWNGVFKAYDPDDASNPDIDIDRHAAANGTANAYFYLKTAEKGKIVGGSDVPNIRSKPSLTPGEPGEPGEPITPAPLKRVGGEDVIRIYIDTVNGGQTVNGLEADFMVEIKGRNGHITSEELYSLPRTFIGNVDAANSAMEMEIGLSLSDIGFAGSMGYFMESTDWQGEADQTAVTSIMTPMQGTRSGGSGTIGDPYRIETLADLQWLTANGVNGYSIQMNDIDASATSTWNGGAGFIPIGDSGVLTQFKGSYDGQGYTITGLFINRPTTSNVGLFGYIGSGGTVKNLGLVANDITGQGTVGGLVGYNGGTVTNSYATGAAKGVSDYYIGGLVGWSQGTVSYSYSSGTVTSVANNVGGLVGLNDAGTISNSYSTATVTFPTGYGIGGLVGTISGGGTVTNSYATGAVTAAASTTYNGGLVGWISGSGSVTNSFYDSQTTGQSDTGKGVPKTTAEMQTLATFFNAGWSIALVQDHVAETWYIYQGHDYPRLSYEEKPLEIPEFKQVLLPILIMLGFVCLGRKNKYKQVEKEIEDSAEESESTDIEVVSGDEIGEIIDEQKIEKPEISEPTESEEISGTDAKDPEEIRKSAEDSFKEPEEIDTSSEPPKIKFTLLIIGVLLLGAGFLGVLGLRMGFIQEYLLGNTDPYPGIGNAEPMGHIVSMVPFVLGMVTVAFWGIRNDPIYREIQKMKEEQPETEEPETEEEIPQKDVPETEAVDSDIHAEPEEPEENELDGLDSDESVSSQAETPALNDLEDLTFDEVFKQEKALPPTSVSKVQEPAQVKQRDEHAENIRVERCQKMLSFAKIFDDDRDKLQKMIETGISVQDFTVAIKAAIDKRKVKEAVTSEQKASVIVEELVAELEELGNGLNGADDDAELEDLLLEELDKL